MPEPPNSFEFDYAPVTVNFGRGSVETLGDELDARGCARALVVCGTNVGANRAVMAPVEAGLGDALVGTYDETTPEKHLETVFDGVERMAADGIDALVAVGGGSSLNVARAMSALAGLDEPNAAIRERISELDAVPTPDPSVALTPILAVPTTMAGADLSPGGGVYADGEVHISDPRLLATAIYYDPALFETTPPDVLAASAMNGFDKGIETLYSRCTNPIADAHAFAGLRYFSAGLRRLGDAAAGDDAYDLAVMGTMLVQYGNYTNIIHTFGNGVSFNHDVHQGIVHGIAAPHVLRYVFERVDGRRRLIAEGLGLVPADGSDEAVANAVVDAVADIRDGLGLPSRLREIDGLENATLPAIADAIEANYKHSRNPPGIDPSVEDILTVLETAW